MDSEEFHQMLVDGAKRLMDDARAKDEFAFLMSILGLNSGMEDAGWQPVGETSQLVSDLLGLIEGPIVGHTKIRLLLLLYCHITEANYHYHIIYNLLLTIEGEPPRLFNFLNLYHNGKPPSVSAKVKAIKIKANELGYAEISTTLDEMLRFDIRNAFFHSDYIIYENDLRLKHRGNQILSVPLDDVAKLAEKALNFFKGFLGSLEESRRSFPKDYVIKDRKTANGMPLSSINVTVNDDGYAIGFSSSDPLPWWGPDG